MALTDVRLRIESSPDPAASTRKLATAERVARQKEQEARLGGIIFTPETTPSNHLVDLYVEMLETGGYFGLREAGTMLQPSPRS